MSEEIGNTKSNSPVNVISKENCFRRAKREPKWPKVFLKNLQIFEITMQIAYEEETF